MKRSCTVFALILAGVTAHSAVTTGTSPTFVLDLQQMVSMTVRGRVLKAADNTPLSGVAVRLGGATATTAADGVFQFADISLLSSSELAITNAPGFGRHVEKIAPEPGAKEIVLPDIRLQSAGFQITDLRGCEGVFLGNISYEAPVTAIIDWNGNTPGNVEFSVNGVLRQTVAASGSQATAPLNMAEEFSWEMRWDANRVEAVAVSSAGVRSPVYSRVISVIPIPQFLVNPVMQGAYAVYKGNDPMISVDFQFPDKDIPVAALRDIPFLGRFGYQMAVSAGFSYALRSGQWSAYAGIAPYGNWKKNEDERPHSTLTQPKMVAGDKSIQVKAVGTAEGIATAEKGIVREKVGVNLSVDYEQELLAFYLSDYVPGAQWLRFLDWAKKAGYDPNSIQKVTTYGTLNFNASLSANTTTNPIVWSPAALGFGFGVKAAYEPSIGIAKGKVYVGGTISPTFNVYPKVEFASINGKVYGGLAVTVWYFKVVDAQFVLINYTWPEAPSAMGLQTLQSTLPEGALDLGGGWAALPLAEPVGDGLIARPNLALGPERFLAADDSGLRTLASLASEEPLAIDALAAFRLMGATPAPASGKPIPLSLEPLSDPPVQADLPLVENVYPESEPALAAYGNELMLLYVGDNGSPNTLQCTDIRWTRWDGTQWSAPAPILADTRAEFAPRVAFDGDGDAIAVWERVADTNFDGDLPDMLGQMEVAWSRWDRATGIWTAPQTLTSNALPDHAPLLAGPADDGSVLAVWSRNAQNLLVGTNGAPDQVLWSQWSPASQSWSAEQTLVSAVSNRLSQALACSTNGYAIYGYTVDPDGVQTNDLDQEVFVCQRQAGVWAAPQNVTTNSVADKHVHLAVAPGDVPVAVWRQGDDLVMRHGIGGATQLVREDSATVALADFAMTLGPDGHLALLWQEMNGEGSDAHYRVFDPDSGTWGEDALLCNDMPLERSFAPVWDAAGNLTVAYQKVQYELVTRTFELEEGGSIEVENMPESGRTDLYVTKRSLVQDLAILPDDFTSDGFNFLPGEMVTLSAVVRNLGDLPVLDPVVAFYDGDPGADGILIGETNVVGLMAASSTNVVQTVWIVPEPAAPHTLYVVANADGLASEANATNNVQTLSVGGTDLLSSLVCTSARPDGSLRIIAQVTNFGAPTAGASTLSIRKSDETGNEVGPVLATVAVPELQPARHAQVALDLPVGTQLLDDEFYQIAANSSGAISEIETNNNATVFSVHVMIDTDGDGMPDSWEKEHALDPDVPAEVGLDTDEDGVPDRDEYPMGLNPRNPDSDGDGASDGDELAAATDPLSATDVFKITTFDGAEAVAMRVRWNAKAGKKYRVETAPALTGVWTNAPSTEIQDGRSLRLADADGVMVYVDADTTPEYRFYRVRIAPEEEEDVPDEPVPPEFVAGSYLKPTNTAADCRFGYSVAVDGDTAIVGAPYQDGVANDSGAAYIFVKTDGVWSQQAYLKASTPGAGDFFGSSVGISGNTAIVGARLENGTYAQSGAAYIFVRTDDVWSQQAYLKASNKAYQDQFGNSVAISGDSVIVGAQFRDDGGSNAGAAYVFTRSAGVWTQQAYLKASNAGAGDCFGTCVDIAGDSAVVSACYEDDIAGDSGAAYVFTRSAGVWSQQAFLKASNAGGSDYFGMGAAIDGDFVIVGASGEDSNATGVDGDPGNNNAADSGAAYIFARTDGVWIQHAYLKATNTGTGDVFGYAGVDICGDIAVVGAFGEGGSATGVNGADDNTAAGAGAAYAYALIGGVWTPLAYLKATNTGAGDRVGIGVATDGATVLVGADEEDGSATVVDGANDNARSIAGAAYTFDIR